MRNINRFRPPPLWALSLLIGSVLIILALASFASPVQAARYRQEDKPTNEFCLACHQVEGESLVLGADTLSVTINPTIFGLSVHAEEGISCVDCHTNITDYPHPEVEANSAREFSVSMKDACLDCHEEQYEAAPDSVHAKAFDEGKDNAPLCANCHDPHVQERIIGQESGELSISARIHVPQTCAQCHSDKYDVYKDSVHGKALTEEGNTDVPTCTECHGVHGGILDPNTPLFRNASPALCADCHDNPEIMDKYDISTEVLETYLADYHGTNVKLVSDQFPNAVTNKAVCFDCHGVHDIAKVDDPEHGIANREILLDKCQQCHPDATENFTGAWLGHRRATTTHHPITYYVNLFYKFFITAVIGGMIFFVITDIYRRRVNRAKGVKHP